MRYAAAVGIAAAGIAIGAFGLYIGEMDDSPGAGLLGIVIALGAIALAVRVAATSELARFVTAVGIAIVGTALVVASVSDDAPGAAIIGLLLVGAAGVLGIRTARRRKAHAAGHIGRP